MRRRKKPPYRPPLARHQQENRHHQQRHQKADGSLDQRGNTGRQRCQPIPASAQNTVMLLGQVGRKDGGADKESQRHVEDDSPGKGHEHRCGRHLYQRQRGSSNPVDPSAEREQHDQQGKAEHGRRQAGSPLGIAEQVQRQGDGLEEESGLVEIDSAIISRHQPAAVLHHFSRYFSIAALVRRQQREIAQMEKGRPGAEQQSGYGAMQGF